MPAPGAAYAAISAALFSGDNSELLMAVLLGIGGLGLGIQFSALIADLTTVVPADYAPDISGVSTTTLQIGGAVGVAAFGTLYLSLASSSAAANASHAFAATSAAFAAAALLAAATAYRTTCRPPPAPTSPDPNQPQPPHPNHRRHSPTDTVSGDR
jgi:hypothetical protein